MKRLIGILWKAWPWISILIVGSLQIGLYRIMVAPIFPWFNNVFLPETGFPFGVLG